MIFFGDLVDWPENITTSVENIDEAINLSIASESLDAALQRFTGKNQTMVIDETLENYGISDIESFKSYTTYLAVLIIMLLVTVFYSMLWCLRSNLNGRLSCFMRLKNKLGKELFYSSWIRYTIESYLELAQTSMFFVAVDINFTGLLTGIQSGIQIFTLIVILIWPFYVLVFIKRKYKKIKKNDEKFMTKYDVLFEELKTKNRW